MKIKYIILVFGLFATILNACMPSAEKFNQTIAETINAYTPIPSQTAYPTYTSRPPYPTYTLYPTYTAIPTKKPSPTMPVGGIPGIKAQTVIDNLAILKISSCPSPTKVKDSYIWNCKTEYGFDYFYYSVSFFGKTKETVDQILITLIPLTLQSSFNATRERLGNFIFELNYTGAEPDQAKKWFMTNWSYNKSVNDLTEYFGDVPFNLTGDNISILLIIGEVK